MLDHLHRGDEVELAVQMLDRDAAIIDREPGPRGVRFGRLDQFGRGVDRGHRGAQSRERLRQQPRAAPDVERSLSFERPQRAFVECPMLVDLVAKVAQPHRVEPVKHCRCALWVPPVAGQGPEVGGFAVDYRACSHVHCSVRAEPVEALSLYRSMKKGSPSTGSGRTGEALRSAAFVPRGSAWHAS